MSAIGKPQERGFVLDIRPLRGGKGRVRGVGVGALAILGQGWGREGGKWHFGQITIRKPLRIFLSVHPLRVGGRVTFFKQLNF